MKDLGKCPETKLKLKDRIDELESENDALQDQIDSISDIISGEDEDDEGGRLTPGCGSGWRKETSQVTDRRLRQRADECRPPGKTVLNYPSYFWAD
jgi:hypothetical protein